MKRKISILLALAMMVSLLGANAYASEAEETATDVIDIAYADVPADAWYAEAVYAMTKGGLLAGYDDGLFHPDDPVTVGQLAVILCRVGGIDGTNSTFVPMKRGNVEYTEPSHWAFMALLNTRENFVYDVAPEWADDQVLRFEAIAVMYQLARKMPEYYTEITLMGGATSKKLLCDLPENQIWSRKNIPDIYTLQQIKSDMVVNGGRYIDVQMDTIVDAYNLGLTHGVDANGTGNFGSTVTRAQLCQMLYNMGISETGCVPFEQYEIKNTQGVQIL